jgi:hypothetical protein
LKLNIPNRKKGCNLSISNTQSHITQSPQAIAPIVFILLAVLNAVAQTHLAGTEGFAAAQKDLKRLKQ